MLLFFGMIYLMILVSMNVNNIEKNVKLIVFGCILKIIMRFKMKKSKIVKICKFENGLWFEVFIKIDLLNIRLVFMVNINWVFLMLI